MLEDLRARDEVLTDFLYETGALLRDLDADLADLPRYGIDSAILARMIRAARGIERASSLLGFVQFTAAAQKADALLTGLHRRELAWTPALRRRLLETVHHLKRRRMRLGPAPAGPSHRHLKDLAHLCL